MSEMVYSSVVGVNWLQLEKAWGVFISKDSKSYRLMAFPKDMLPMAIDMRKEAETMSADELPELKEKYKELRQKVAQGFEYKPVHTATEIKVESNDGRGGGPSQLTDLLRKARAADEKVAKLNAEVQALRDREAEAFKEAVAAWDAVADELVGASSYTAVILQSKLGKLLTQE